MGEPKRKLYVERDGFFTEAAMLFLALAVVFRLIGSIGRWEDTRYLLTQVALPAFSGLLFLLCLLFAGKRAFWTTVIPVVLGVVFFIFRSMGVEGEWEMVGWIVLYVVIAVLYAMTFSIPKLKWALAAILSLVFLYHVMLKDVPRLLDLENPVSFVDGMEEMSVLGAVLALLCTSLAMKFPPLPAAPAEPLKPAAPEAEEPLKPAALEAEPEEEAAPEVWEETPWKPEQAPLEESFAEPAPAEPLPAETPVPVQELGCVAEPAPAYPVEEPENEEDKPREDERDTE